jgi:hypothetical protein
LRRRTWNNCPSKSQRSLEVKLLRCPRNCCKMVQISRGRPLDGWLRVAGRQPRQVRRARWHAPQRPRLRPVRATETPTPAMWKPNRARVIPRFKSLTVVG